MTEQRKNRQATLASVIQTGIDSALKNVHTSIPGIVEKFNPSTQTADVVPAIKKVLRDGTELTLPKKVNAPVYFPRSGGFSITMPVAEGDECLLLFSERSLETWIKFGKLQAPKTDRMHDLSDVLVMPMKSSQKSVDSNFNSEYLQIKSDDPSGLKITIRPDGKIQIENSLYDLVGLINDFIASVNGSSNSGGPLVANPVGKPFPQLQTELATFKV